MTLQIIGIRDGGFQLEERVRSWPGSEAEMAKVLVSWLQDMKWDVYQEVQVRSYGQVADIVATRGPLTWIIECKTTFGLKIIGQANWWLGRANWVSIATPLRRNETGCKILRSMGLGWLSVMPNDVIEEVHPQLYRNLRSPIKRILCEEHKTFAEAGNAMSDRFSPFKRTCRAVEAIVRQRPGITMKELIESVETHYVSTATARTALAAWTRNGSIPGVRVEKDHGLLRFYLSFSSEDNR